MNEFKHYTVMKYEAVDALECRPGKIYVDATLGGGGHSLEIVKRISPDGMLICFDVDDDAIAAASKKLEPYKNNVKIIKSSYVKIPEVLKELNIPKITGGIVFDLGASYHQLTLQERGFSFSKEAPLDMRFDQNSDFSAYDVVNNYKEDDLIRIFSEYGEERFSKRIAKAIVEKRNITKLETTVDLANLIIEATPRVNSRIHPATRVFQAIRIEVNQELQNVKNTLNNVVTLLEKGAIISVISFHSLEDRIVKKTFKYFSQKCHCEPHEMVCKCEPVQLELVNKKPIVATAEEIRENPPSRSAKLRIAKKV